MDPVILKLLVSLLLLFAAFGIGVLCFKHGLFSVFVWLRVVLVVFVTWEIVLSVLLASEGALTPIVVAYEIVFLVLGIYLIRREFLRERRKEELANSE